jgi:hypothetical protein
MTILRALYDAWLVAFWTLVVWSGGPRHHSYGHARWEQWTARQRLGTFLRGNENGRG